MPSSLRARRFRSQLEGDHISTAPVVANRPQSVYRGDDDVFYALDAATGELQWAFTTGGKPSGPSEMGVALMVANGVEYAGAHGETV